MLTRWWVPIDGVNPAEVGVHHVHAVVSSFLDDNPAEHRYGEKPYGVTPMMANPRGEVGVEVSLYNEAMIERLRERTTQRAGVRLGRQHGQIGPLRLVGARQWQELRDSVGHSTWHIDLLTPATFRNGDRDSPLPSVRTVVDGLVRCWAAWGPDPAPDQRKATAASWISQLNLRSETVTYPMNRGGRRIQVAMTGSLGAMEWRCEPQAHAVVGPLMALAEFTGIGGMTRRGFGQVSVTPIERVPDRRRVA